MLGAMTLFNIQPGPFLFVSHPEFVWGLIASMYIGNGMLLILNILFVPVFVSALRIPFTFLGPLIVIFATIGVYSVSGSMFDVIVLFSFSVLGYFMKKLDYPAAPMVLALVLGNGLETALRQSLMISQGDVLIFFTRPISGTLMALMILMLVVPFVRRMLGLRNPIAGIEPDSHEV